MRSLVNKLDRYLNAGSSSLAFWWLRAENWSDSSPPVLEQFSAVPDYALDFRRKTEYRLHFDSAGVPLLDYRGTLGVRYNPCAIAQLGLGHLSSYLRDGTTHRLEKARAQADWLLQTMDVDADGVGRWWYDYGNDGFKGLETPYVSGIAQGQGVSLLLRMHRLLPDRGYGPAASAAFRTFELPTDKGGVQHVDDRGRLFLEEFPTSKLSCILDGFIFAIFAAHDKAELDGDAAAGEILRRSLDTLVSILPDFDLKFWSRTDLVADMPKMPASPYYHDLHVKQLKALFAIAENDTIRHYAELWDGYQKNPLNRAALLAYKSYMKVFYY